MAYNGWSNWATWNVALWADNDESLYRMKRSALLGEDPADVDADMVRDAADVMFPSGTTPDGASLDDVDWDEIAEAWTEDILG